MNREVLEGPSSAVRSVVLPIGSQWEGTGTDRKLSFGAKSPTGGSVYIPCNENDLAGELQVLLGLI